MTDFRSKYFEFGFSKDLINRRIITWIAFLLGSFALVAIFHFDGSETYSRRLWTKIIYGLLNTSINDLLITLITGLIVATLAVVIINFMYNNRPLVVGLNFNDEKKQLKLTTRTLSDSTNETCLAYSSLKIVNEEMSDGINAPSAAKIFFNDVIL